MGAPPLRSAGCAVAVVLMLGLARPSHARSAPFSTETVMLRGHAQTLHLYGRRGAAPVVLSSGDGGWIHLAPHVAELLASCGYFVVGLDSRAYLESFTSVGHTLQPDDVAGDYVSLIDYASRGGSRRPVLVGVSEGGGLAVLAATDRRVKERIDGVIGLGLGDLNELGWHWTDATIYLTHRVPHEPTFSVLALVRQIAPVPLAAIHSTHDEFVPVEEAERIVKAAAGPAQLWTVSASNHRFSGKEAEFDRRLIESFEWVREHQLAATRP